MTHLKTQALMTHLKTQTTFPTTFVFKKKKKMQSMCCCCFFLILFLKEAPLTETGHLVRVNLQSIY